MKKRIKEPAIPSARQETVRQKILSLLEGRTLSAKELSPEVSASEKEVYGHLEHIRMKKDIQLVVTAAECRKCGYAFRKRERLKKPGKCPICKRETITEPLFSIRKR
jgi:predicted Zn-ribbon and HTH transcriptional regulator